MIFYLGLLQTYTFEHANIKLNKCILCCFWLMRMVNVKKRQIFCCRPKIVWNRMFSCTVETFECFINVGVLKNVVYFDNILISFFSDRMRKEATFFDMAWKFYEYHSAIPGYHSYKKYWQPIEGKTLDCMHRKDNSFDLFAKTVMEQNSGRTVGHLAMENSRVTKYLLDHGMKMTKMNKIKRMTEKTHLIMTRAEKNKNYLKFC